MVDAVRPGSDVTRVLLVDDHDLFRTGLATCSRKRASPSSARPATGAEALAHASSEVAPDVVVMDLNMPGMTGVEATRHIVVVAPLARVLVLTISDQDDDVIDAILAGACGYLLKDSSIQRADAGDPGGLGRRIADLARPSPRRCSSACVRRARCPRSASRSAPSSPTARSRC